MPVVLTASMRSRISAVAVVLTLPSVEVTLKRSPLSFVAVPAFQSMFGVSQSYAAMCLIVFVVGSAGGMLLGGYFADRMSRHERVAAIGVHDRKRGGASDG